MSSENTDPNVGKAIRHSGKSVKDPQGHEKPFLISIEGNIGSGKSTLLKFFDTFDDVTLCPEPVSQWCNLRGHNLLGKLYEDQSRWSFQFQSYVQLTRLQILQEPCTTKVKIIERSIQNNRFCFLQLAKKNGSLTDEELIVLSDWHDWLDSTMDLSLDLIVYLRTSPQTAYDRMRTRNRKEEASAPLSYLAHLHQAYEEWLIEQKFGEINVPILVLDANHGLDEMKKMYTELKDIIRGNLGPVKGLIQYDHRTNSFMKIERPIWSPVKS